MIFGTTGLNVYEVHQHPDQLIYYIDTGVTFGVGLWLALLGTRQ